MKVFKIVLIVSLCSLFCASLTSAQEEASELAGYYIIDAPMGGEITDNGDGTYEMLLLGVLPDIFWVVSQPSPYMGDADLLTLASEWEANPQGLTARALVETGDIVLDVTMSAPSYDDFLEELVVSVTVEDIYANDDELELEVPSFFEIGAVAIVLDSAFDTGLAFGAEIMMSEGRASNTNRKNRATAPGRSRSGTRGGS